MLLQYFSFHNTSDYDNGINHNDMSAVAVEKGIIVVKVCVRSTIMIFTKCYKNGNIDRILKVGFFARLTFFIASG